MAIKDPKQQAAAGKAWYEKNKELTKARTKQRNKDLRDEWAKFKASLCCVTCGENRPPTFDFHHPDPTTKTGAVNDFVRQRKFKKAFEEVAKCIVLCANCHRIHHHEERRAKKRKHKKKGAKAP